MLKVGYYLIVYFLSLKTQSEHKQEKKFIYNIHFGVKQNKKTTELNLIQYAIVSYAHSKKKSHILDLKIQLALYLDNIDSLLTLIMNE